jgi:hypothetical protein
MQRTISKQSMISSSSTLQRHCTENMKQIFLEMKLRGGLVLNSYIQDTWMWKLETRPRFFISGNT